MTLRWGVCSTDKRMFGIAGLRCKIDGGAKLMAMEWRSCCTAACTRIEEGKDVGCAAVVRLSTMRRLL